MYIYYMQLQANCCVFKISSDHADPCTLGKERLKQQWLCMISGIDKGNTSIYCCKPALTREYWCSYYCPLIDNNNNNKNKSCWQVKGNIHLLLHTLTRGGWYSRYHHFIDHSKRCLTRETHLFTVCSSAWREEAVDTVIISILLATTRAVWPGKHAFTVAYPSSSSSCWGPTIKVSIILVPRHLAIDTVIISIFLTTTRAVDKGNMSVYCLDTCPE